ncbi:hypothetical protein AMTRI_Chr11g154620 [Amborella trichopoda]
MKCCRESLHQRNRHDFEDRELQKQPQTKMQCWKMKTPGMDVEDEDIPDMPTHSRARLVRRVNPLLQLQVAQQRGRRGQWLKSYS